MMKLLNALARTTNAAVILAHHTRKTGEKSSKTIDALAGRGASNWGNLSRKNKGRPLLDPAKLKLNRETLWFEYIGTKAEQNLSAETIQAFVGEKGEASSADITNHFLALGFKQKTIERRVKAPRISDSSGSQLKEESSELAKRRSQGNDENIDVEMKAIVANLKH
jgi:hypothetical protein